GEPCRERSSSRDSRRGGASHGPRSRRALRARSTPRSRGGRVDARGRVHDRSTAREMLRTMRRRSGKSSFASRGLPRMSQRGGRFRSRAARGCRFVRRAAGVLLVAALAIARGFLALLRTELRETLFELSDHAGRRLSFAGLLDGGLLSPDRLLLRAVLEEGERERVEDRGVLVVRHLACPFRCTKPELVVAA